MLQARPGSTGGRVLQTRGRYECACVRRARRGSRKSGGRARAADTLDGHVLQTRRKTGASAGGGHCEAVEGRADEHVLRIG